MSFLGRLQRRNNVLDYGYDAVRRTGLPSPSGGDSTQTEYGLSVIHEYCVHHGVFPILAWDAVRMSTEWSAGRNPYYTYHGAFHIIGNVIGVSIQGRALFSYHSIVHLMGAPCQSGRSYALGQVS